MGEFIARNLVLLLVEEAVPGITSCRLCQSALDATVVDVVGHYWAEHPWGTALAVGSAAGVAYLLGTSARGWKN